MLTLTAAASQHANHHNALQMLAADALQIISSHTHG